jgi:hypothetical protein
MRTIAWIGFQEDHLVSLGLTNIEAVRPVIGPYAYTGVCEGEVVCCAGVTLLWQGVGEAWLFVSEGARAYIGLPGAVRELLDTVRRNLQLHRIQATVRVDNPRAHRMDTWLGFKEEGIMRKYTPDKTDCYRMARVW